MLGEKLKKVREARNISQTKAAYDLKIGRQTLCNWENDYAQPSISKLEKLADYYNVSIYFTKLQFFTLKCLSLFFQVYKIFVIKKQIILEVHL